MTDDDRIAALITGWAHAVARGDRDGVLANHAADILMIDFPNTVSGIDAYAKTWAFFDDSRRGPVTFSPSGLKVTASGDVAFAHCNIHCDGTTAGPIDLRLTVGLVKHEDAWIITHEHHSMPTKDEVLIGPDVPR